MKKFKEDLWAAINRYTTTCGGDPSSQVQGNTARQKAVVEIESLIDQPAPKEIQEALEMLDGYITQISQTNAKKYPNRFSGAEGNMLFKIQQIKTYLKIK